MIMMEIFITENKGLVIEDFTYLVNSARTLRRSKKVDPLLKGAETVKEKGRSSPNSTHAWKRHISRIFLDHPWYSPNA